MLLYYAESSNNTYLIKAQKNPMDLFITMLFYYMNAILAHQMNPAKYDKLRTLRCPVTPVQQLPTHICESNLSYPTIRVKMNGMTIEERQQ
jgi:hypothetical protein